MKEETLMAAKVSRVVRAVVVATLTLATMLLLPRMAAAHDMSTPPPVSPAAAKCEALIGGAFATVPDAPTHVASAKLVSGDEDKPVYCEVEGFVAPQVGILMRLPVDSWNGKFMEVGCGGFCGTTAFIALCDDPLRKGYACITTDMGHKGKEAEGVEWAYNNPQAVIDFAYRATHVTALAGKAIAEGYYGRKPEKSYFAGCSCGGRQALVEAERFPWDFNGIIVGAPGINYPDIALTFAMRSRHLLRTDGQALFDAGAIKIVGDAIIAKCDINDGLKDGLIGDPRSCKFDPRAIVCPSPSATGCLTRDQAEAIVAVSGERKSSSGDRVGERAYLPGWETSYLGLVDNPIMHRTFYEDFMKYMALIPNPGPGWKFEQFDMDADYKRMGMIQALMQADNPDLHRFKAAGGKLIFYHGWADGGPSPLGSIAFYKSVETAMGGRASTEDFFRLFMVPDMDHCMGGNGAWSIDYLAYMEKWVEQGKAPDMLIGSHFSEDPMDPMFARRVAPEKAKFTRPAFPYPLRAQYKGSGDPNSASSFKAVNSES